MGFLSSTRNLPAAAQKPLNVDATRASTNEQARPIPYLAGKNRIGITWISDFFDVRTDAVTRETGKDQTSTVGYNYYASIAGLLCHGPLDSISSIYFNGELVWSGNITRGAEDFVDITIAGHGQMRLYWGTGTQTTDTYLQSSGYDHPPYKYQAYVIFQQVFLGFNQTNAPNVEIICARYPKPGWMTAAVNLQDDCNPIAVIAEWMSSPVFGLNSSKLNTAALDAAAVQLASEGIGLSPYVTRQQSARQLIVQLCEYFDGYPVDSAPDGLLSVGLARSPADVGALPAINENDLVDEPDLDPDSWRGCKTKTWIKFTNRYPSTLPDGSIVAPYKDDALPYRDPGASQIVGDNTPQTLDRPWVTHPTVAQKIVAAAGRASALPSGSGTLVLKKKSAVNLSEGGLLRFSYTPYGLADLVLRIKSKTLHAPPARQVTLEVDEDRAWFNAAFYLPADDTPPAPANYDPQPFAAQKIFELPYGLGNDSQPTLATLAARPNRFTTSYNIWLRKPYSASQVHYVLPFSLITNGTVSVDYPVTPVIDSAVGIVVTGIAPQFEGSLVAAFVQNELLLAVQPQESMAVFDYEKLDATTYRFYVIRALWASPLQPHPATVMARVVVSDGPLFTYSYDQIGSHNRFARHGQVATENYPATTELIDSIKGIVVQLDSADTTLDPLTLDDAFARKLLLLVDDEIISVSNVTLIAAGKYRVFGIRARYDSRRQAHAIGAQVFIMLRSDFNKLSDQNLFYYSARCVFKLQPVVFGKTLDLSQVTPVTCTISGRAARALAPLNLRVSGDGANPTYTAGQGLPITWSLCSEKRGSFWGLWGHPVATNLPYVILEFRTLAGDLKTTVTTAAGATSITFTNAQLIAAFGSETDVLVRAYAAYGTNQVSLFNDQVIVRKL